MIGIRDSEWEFETSGSGGISVVLSFETGVIDLKDPSKKIHRFHYGAIGYGPSDRVKLPFKIKVPPVLIKILDRIFGKTITRSTGPTFFKSYGLVFMTDAFKGKELSASDICGPCAFIEVGAGAVIGHSGYAMLLGLDPKLVAKYLLEVSKKSLSSVHYGLKMLLSAKCLLLTRGWNASLGWNLCGYLGYLGDKLPHLDFLAQYHPPPETQRYPLPPRVPAQPLAHNRLASAGVRNTQNQHHKVAHHHKQQHHRPLIPKQNYREIEPGIYKFESTPPIYTDQPHLHININYKNLKKDSST